MAKISNDTVIFSKKPSSDPSVDASIVGNGRVWGSLLGAKSGERITLYRRDLNAGGYTGVLQDVSDKFPTVRKMFADGKVLDAEKVLANEFKKRNCKPSSDKPFALPIIKIDYMLNGFVQDYKRTTDMETGEVEVAFKSGNSGVSRRAFVSHATDMFVYTAESQVNATVSIDTANLPTGAQVTYTGGYITMAARNASGQDYGFVVRVVSNNQESLSDKIVVRNAEEMTVYVKTFNNASRDAEFKKIRAELESVKSYDKMFSQSSSAHEKMWNTTQISLGNSPTKDHDFDAMLSRAGEGFIDPGLVGRLINLGKYISICGVDTGDVSLFNAMQLVYCGSMSDVTEDMVLKLFEFYEKYADDLKKNASRVYGMKGYFIPSTVSPASALFGSVDSGTLHFVASSALAANVFYRYYFLSADTKMLKSRILPFMREVMNFYSDFLKLDPSGRYTTIPSYSPKSVPGNTIGGNKLSNLENFAFTVNSTVDFLAIDALLDNLIHAEGQCGQADDTVLWRDMKSKMPAYGVNDQGGIKEYTNCAFIDKAENLGTMHAYGLWPLKNISFGDKVVDYKPAVITGGKQEQTISLRQASLNAVKQRLGSSWHLCDGRVLCTSLAQVAHSGIAEGAQFAQELILRVLSSVVGSGGLMANNDWRGGESAKSTGTPAFDVATTIGFATAMTECIIQSNTNTLRVLPVSMDALSSGTVRDIPTDFCGSVSIDWDVQKGRCVVKIVPKITTKINIEVSKQFRKIKDKVLKMDPSINGLRDVQLTQGKAITFEFA